MAATTTDLSSWDTIRTASQDLITAWVERRWIKGRRSEGVGGIYRNLGTSNRGLPM